jgi:hypothetical protein
MSGPVVFYVGYGLPLRVPLLGAQALHTLLSGSLQDSRLSIESEIMLSSSEQSSLLTSSIPKVTLLLCVSVITMHPTGWIMLSAVTGKVLNTTVFNTKDPICLNHHKELLAELTPPTTTYQTRPSSFHPIPPPASPST